MIIKELTKLRKDGSVTLYDKNKAFELMNTIDGDTNEVFTVIENGVFHFISNIEGAYNIRARLLDNEDTIKGSYAIQYALEQVYLLIKYFCKGSF